MNYGKRLKSLINDSKYEYQEIAEKIGVTPANISQLTTKNYPRLEKIEQICEILGIKVWEFFLDEPEVLEKHVEDQRYIKLFKAITKLEEKDQAWLLNIILEWIDKLHES